MKTALEEAQANLTIAQSRTKSQVDHSRRDEKFEVGDEVVLSTRHISVNQHLPSKLWRCWIGPYRVAKVISPMAYRLDVTPSLTDPFCLPCVDSQKVEAVQGVQKGGETTFSDSGRW